MIQFSLTIESGRPLLINNDEVLLVAIGWPTSIHYARNLVFCGKNYTCSTSTAEINVDKVSQLVGRDLTGVLGMDVLSDYDVLLDYKNGIMGVDDKMIEKKEMGLPIRQYMGIPVVEVSFDGTKANLYIDSASNLSFLSNHQFRDGARQPEREEFSFVLGQHLTPVIRKEVSVGNIHFPVDFGRVPMQLDQVCAMAGIDGVFGSELFKQNQILLSSRRSLLWVS